MVGGRPKKRPKTLAEKRAIHEKWRKIYGTERTNIKGDVLGTWTYRAIADDFNVDATTVWAALHPEAKRANSPARRNPARPFSTRIALSTEEHEALRERAVLEKTSMMGLVRDIVFGKVGPMEELQEPQLEPDPQSLGGDDG